MTQPGGSRFYADPATPLVLPYYARADLAFQWPTTLDPGIAPQLVHTVGGDFVELPVSLYAQVTTGALVADRTVTLTYLLPDGGNAAQVLPAAIQPASTTYTYQYLFGVSATTVVAGNELLPLPQIILTAGWTLSFGPQHIPGAGDVVSYSRLIVTRYPTGPQRQHDPALVGLAAPLELG